MEHCDQYNVCRSKESPASCNQVQTTCTSDYKCFAPTCSEAEGDGFLGRIVTGDETGVHYHQPETKKASEEWRHTSSLKPKKIRTQPSAGKVMLTLFWDKRGVILEHYMPRWNTVTSTTYADLLKNHLHPAIKSKRRGRLSNRCFAPT